MQRYIKGARSERELLAKFYDNGYSVLRSAGSGVSSLGPDIIAIKDGICLSFECKAWDRGSLSIDPESFDKLLRWERNTSSHTFVAWRRKNRGWLFVKTGEFSRAERNYNVTMKRAMQINRGIDQVLAIGLAKRAAIAEPIVVHGATDADGSAQQSADMQGLPVS